MLLIAAWRIWFGVTKSGWPTASEMTPSMLASRSKKRRMPDDGIACTCCEMLPRCVEPSLIVRPSGCTRRGSEPPADHAIRPAVRPDARPQIQLWHIIQEKRCTVRETHAEAHPLLLAPPR